MKVVKQKSTGRIVHREEPEFKPGKGKENASTSTGILETDLEEVEVSQADWDAEMALRADERKEGQLNRPEIKALIEAIEIKLSMGKGTFGQMVKDKLA